MKQPVQCRLAAILAADVAGYSRLMGVDEEGTHEQLKTHLNELVQPKIGEHRGASLRTPATACWRNLRASWRQSGALPNCSGGWPIAMVKFPRTNASLSARDQPRRRDR